MKVAVAQQRALLDLAGVDAELSRLTHRAGNLPEQQRVEQLTAEHRAATDHMAVTALAAIRTV